MTRPSTTIRTILLGTLLLGALPLAAAEDGHEHEHDDHHEHQRSLTLTAVSERNLGVRFATAEPRVVTARVLVPGHLEHPPSAQVHYPAPAAGRVTLHIAPLDTVAAGDPLISLDAPRWRRLQQELLAAEAEATRAEQVLAEASATESAVRPLIDGAPPSDGHGHSHGSGQDNVYRSRVVTARAQLATARLTVERLLAEAGALSGLSPATLITPDDEGQPLWLTTETLTIHARSAGRVRDVAVASGSWVEQGRDLVHLVEESHLRFRGSALQADLDGRLREGHLATLLPAAAASDDARPVTGRLRLGLTGDPRRRTLDVFVDLRDALAADPRPAWLRPEMAVFAEVVVAGDREQPQLAVPRGAVIRDGLEHVLFRRDRFDDARLLRIPVEVLARGERYTAVSGKLEVGDEVAIDGVYQLKLATAEGGAPEGVHVHADGTVHEEH